MTRKHKGIGPLWRPPCDVPAMFSNETPTLPLLGLNFNAHSWFCVSVKGIKELRYELYGSRVHAGDKSNGKVNLLFQLG